MTNPANDIPAPGTIDHAVAVEQIRPLPAGYAPRLVVFDFDGTLSFIRAGWPPIMAGLMATALAETGGNFDDYLANAYDRVYRTAGQPTLHQMQWLADEVRKHGGSPLPAEEYKRLYLEELGTLTHRRTTELREGRVKPEALLVPGTGEFLAALPTERLVLGIASGTDQKELRYEAGLLGIAHYFGRHIYGPDPSHPEYTKAWLFKKLLHHYNLPGTAFLGFGDGPVEIEAIVAAGGVAAALITNEVTGQGIDEIKRERLIEAGAHIILPNYTSVNEILAITKIQG